MGELKSAWEIAQERANRLGKLSAEERELQERQRYRQIGQALAQRWLDSSQQVNIVSELNKHEERARRIIRQALIERLVEVIGFSTGRDMNSIRGIINMVGTLQPELQSTAEETHQLVQQYDAAEQKMRQELETRYRETLHQLRISGTAVDAVNVEATQEWQSARQKLNEALTPRLNELKQKLVRSATESTP